MGIEFRYLCFGECDLSSFFPESIYITVKWLGSAIVTTAEETRYWKCKLQHIGRTQDDLLARLYIFLLLDFSVRKKMKGMRTGYEKRANLIGKM
jgi:hypothetical protein